MSTATLPAPAPATAPAATIALGDVHRAWYEEHGWLALPRIAPPDEVERLRVIYDDLFARRVGRDEGRQFDLLGTDEEGVSASVPQILGPEQYAPEMMATTAWANARVILTALLGAEPLSMSGHAILKPAGSPAPTPWHQDEAYWNPALTHRSASIWIPLQDVDLANGCMHFVPGSHHGEVLEHRNANNDPRIHGLELVEGQADLSRQIHVPLAAGGCTVHGGRMLHYTTPNRSAAPRRAWIIMGGLAGAPYPQPRRFPWMERQTTARADRAAEAARAKAAAVI